MEGFCSGVNNEDISYWLRRVQFKLHDTYANSVRMIETPPYEVEETGWGEFEIAIKFYFNPESTEKPQQIWHGLKLHPYHGDVEQQKRDRTMISSVCYEEVLFNEPVEHFYDVLTGGIQISKSKGGKGGKGTIKRLLLLKYRIRTLVETNSVVRRKVRSWIVWARLSKKSRSF